MIVKYFCLENFFWQKKNIIKFVNKPTRTGFRDPFIPGSENKIVQKRTIKIENIVEIKKTLSEDLIPKIAATNGMRINGVQNW